MADIDELLRQIEEEEKFAAQALGKAATADPTLESRTEAAAPAEPPGVGGQMLGMARSDLGKSLIGAAITEGALAATPLGAPALAAKGVARLAPILGGRALAGAGVQLGVEGADALLPDEESLKAIDPNANPGGYKKTVQAAKDALAKGGFGQFIGDTLGLMGGRMFGLLTEKGVGFLADVGVPMMQGLRGRLRVFQTGRDVAEDDAPLAAMDALMDLWQREGTMTAGERQLIQAGKFQEFVNTRFQDFAKTVGPAMDMADFAKLAAARAKRGQKLGNQLYGAAYGEINKKVGGNLVQTGLKPGALQGEILDAAGEPRRLLSEEAKAAIGTFPSLRARATGGLSVDVRSLREMAQKIQGPVRATDEPYGKLVSGFVEALSSIGDRENYLVVDAMRKDLGKAIATLEARGSALKPADVGDLKALYGRISEVQREGLKKGGYPELAEDLGKLNKAYSAWTNEFDNVLLRQLGEAVDPQKRVNAATIAKTLDTLSPRELEEAMKAFGPRLTNQYRAAYAESIIKDAIKPQTDNLALSSLDGKALMSEITKNEDKLRLLFKDAPHAISNMKQLASMMDFLGQKSVKQRLARAGASVNQDGFILTMATREAGKPMKVDVLVPNELIPYIMADKWAAKTFMSKLAGGTARSVRGTAGRTIEDELREFVSATAGLLAPAEAQARVLYAGESGMPEAPSFMRTMRAPTPAMAPEPPGLGAGALPFDFPIR